MTLQLLEYAYSAISVDRALCLNSKRGSSTQLTNIKGWTGRYSDLKAPTATSCAEIMLLQHIYSFAGRLRGNMAVQAYSSSCKVTMDYQHWYPKPNTQGEARHLWIRPIEGPYSHGGCTAACCEWLIGIRCTCSGRLCPTAPFEPLAEEIEHD